ncbi:MAG: hypothetical protein JXA69_11050 [Phycisphaerae bacterium]|nr:hypothetical protein [Phycisphaerae bacterium]
MRTNANTMRNRILAAMMMGLGILAAFGASGCDDYVEAGDFWAPSVEPMDFSPYGYDYSMYDLFTADI